MELKRKEDRQKFSIRAKQLASRASPPVQTGSKDRQSSD